MKKYEPVDLGDCLAMSETEGGGWCKVEDVARLEASHLRLVEAVKKCDGGEMNLHGEIMNIPSKSLGEIPNVKSDHMAYLYGHRDARHAAAELAIGTDGKIEKLEALCRKMATLLERTPVDVMNQSRYAKGIREALAEAEEVLKPIPAGPEGIDGEVVG